MRLYKHPTHEVKGATKLYFMHYLCVVTVLYNTGLNKFFIPLHFMHLLPALFDVIFINFITFV